jgi:hypothetical protein
MKGKGLGGYFARSRTGRHPPRWAPKERGRSRRMKGLVSPETAQARLGGAQLPETAQLPNSDAQLDLFEQM